MTPSVTDPNGFAVIAFFINYLLLPVYISSTTPFPLKQLVATSLFTCAEHLPASETFEEFFLRLFLELALDVVRLSYSLVHSTALLHQPLCK